MGCRCFILAGEASGDLHGANLAKEIKGELFGIAGPRMRKAGVRPILRQEEFEIMGFTGVLTALPKLKRQLKICADAAMDADAAILIDYGGFNLRLAQLLRKRGYKGKIIQYISPKVWAWGKGRIPKMAKALDLLLVIFPFEEKVFEGVDLDVEYVGNPLTEEMAKFVPDPDWCEERPLALFPGSRRSEILHNLPQMLATAEELKRQRPSLHFAISIANLNVQPLVVDALHQSHLDALLVPPEQAGQLMHHACAALAVSGTVNLQLALHRTPTVVVYRASWINLALAALLVRLPYYSIANIVAGTEFMPELLGPKFTPRRAARHLALFLDDTPVKAAFLKECDEVARLLDIESKPSSRAAEAITKLIHTNRVRPAVEG